MDDLFELTDPLIHSHASDVLPDDHPRAWERVDCLRCGKTVHAFNNECMQTWVELPDGSAYCLRCFVEIDGGASEWAR